MLIENRGDVVILAPRHRVDTNNSPEVEKVVFENIGDGEGKMVIDRSGSLATCHSPDSMFHHGTSRAGR